MSEVVGGLRLVYIIDSFKKHLIGGLDAKGWLTPNAGARLPLEVLTEALDPNLEIQPNKVAISFDEATDDPREIGSNLTDDILTGYVDIFAESEHWGRYLAADISALLRGKFPSVGYGSQSLPVYDPMTDESLFTCEIKDVVTDRNRFADRGYNKFWWTVTFSLVDTYSDDES